MTRDGHTEVARLRLPVSVNHLARLVDALEKAYKAKLYMAGQHEWLIITKRVIDEPREVGKK